jgi:mannosyltransferase OCH1-like enzyme
MKIHQILINDDNNIPKILPKITERCCDSVRECIPGDYHLYSGKEIEDILLNNFSEEVYLSYKKLNPYAFKCDLARACLLYLYGGVYVDLHIQMMSDIDMEFFEKYNFCAPRAHFDWQSQGLVVQNNFMIAKPGAVILERLIQNIVHNCRVEYYGHDVTCISGMFLLGKLYSEVILKEKEENMYLFADIINITPDRQKRRYALVSNFGDLIGVIQKGKDIRETGLTGVNWLTDFGNDRNVYNTNIKI